ncbi:MAG: hypothetical protein CM15mV134_030 [uncultured marine virus]|nr:MAG: hypothetical protein CM15mV134_030 [uncultured marine virus]
MINPKKYGAKTGVSQDIMQEYKLCTPDFQRDAENFNNKKPEKGIFKVVEKAVMP